MASFIESFNDRICESKQITSLDESEIDSLYDDRPRNHFDVFIWKPINCIGTIILSNNDDNFWTFLVNNCSKWKIIEVRDLDSIREFIVLQDAKWIRVVRVLKNQRWDFFEYGTPLSFEKNEEYNNRVKKDRLTSELLSWYCEENGCNIISEEFLKCDKVGYYFRVSKQIAKTIELIRKENGKLLLDDGFRQSLDALLERDVESVSFNYHDKPISIIKKD